MVLGSEVPRQGTAMLPGIVAKQRAGQRGLPSSLNALAENPGQPEVETSWDGRGEGLPLLPTSSK